MPKTAVQVSPLDHGKPMTLENFEHAETQPGRLYELSRGIVTVSDVPDRKHLAQVEAIRDQLAAYKLANPGRIHALPGGAECKILVSRLESERHPDLAVYQTPAPPGPDIWEVWIPEIVVEVVSPSSEQRDYREKPEEYLQFGVKEYWIVDAARAEMRVMRRARGRWAETCVRPPEIYRTRLLPELAFDCGAVFRAAEPASAE